MSTLTEAQRKRFVSLLDMCGFKLSSQGGIDVKSPLDGHPDWTPEVFSRQGHKFYLPVGFLASNKLEMVNTDAIFPRDYHGQLEALYQLVSRLEPKEISQTRP